MDRGLRNPFGSYLVTLECTLRAKSYATSTKKATGLQLTVAQGNKLKPIIGNRLVLWFRVVSWWQSLPTR